MTNCSITCNRFETDDELFRKHWFNRNSKSATSYSCGEGCKKSILCDQRSSVFDTYLDCMSNSRSPRADPTQSGAARLTKLSLIAVIITTLLAYVM